MGLTYRKQMTPGLKACKDYYEGKNKTENKEEELTLNVNSGFKFLKESLEVVSASEGLTGQNWMKDVGLGVQDLTTLSGAKDLWKDKPSALKLKERLEIAIVNMFEEATEDVIGFDPTTNQSMLRKDWGFDNNTVFEMPLVRNNAVMKMWERYLADETIKIPNQSGELQDVNMPKPKSAGMLLNKEYEQDGMYHKGGGRIFQEAYGSTPHDAVFYYAIDLWKQLEDAYPTEQLVITP